MAELKALTVVQDDTLSLKALGYCYYISILGCLAEISFSSLMHFSVEKLDVFSLVRVVKHRNIIALYISL